MSDIVTNRSGSILEIQLNRPAKKNAAPGENPQARLISALIDFEKPIVAAVQGVAIGGGTTMPRIPVTVSINGPGF